LYLIRRTKPFSFNKYSRAILTSLLVSLLSITAVSGDTNTDQVTEGWIVHPVDYNGNLWLGSDLGRGITWLSESAAGNPNNFPVVVVLSSTNGTLQILDARDGSFVTNATMGTTGDSTIGTYRLDSFSDGVLATNGFQGTVRVADDSNGTNPRNVTLNGASVPASNSRALSVAGSFSAGTGIIGLGRANTVELFVQDAPSSDSFSLLQVLKYASDIGSQETIIDSTVDGIGISPGKGIIIVSNSANQDDVALYQKVGDKYDYIRILGVFNFFARQDVDTDGKIIVATESSGFFGDSFGVGLIEDSTSNDFLFQTDPTVATENRGYNAGDSIELDAPNLAATITLGGDGKAYGYSASSAVFQLVIPQQVSSNQWILD